MKEKAVFSLCIILYLVNSYTYAQSDFILHEISAEAENDLELVAYHINMVDDNSRGKFIYQGYFQEYVFYNNGNVTHNVVFELWYQEPSDIPPELFLVNGAKVQHQLVRGDESTHYGYSAFIDVAFLAHEETRIRVNNLSYLRGRRTDISFMFKGSLRFTATIGNNLIDLNRPIEEYIINDIFVNRRSESLVSMLEQKGFLSNDLFTIHKTDGNTWEIEFTRKFVDMYLPNLTIDIEYGSWGYIGQFYNPLWDNRGFVFDSEESITPYQYIFLTNRQLQVVRNAYYARHGYIFKNAALARMYNFEGYYARSFGNINYRENPNFTEDMLTDTDRANIAIIQALEALAPDPVRAYTSAFPETEPSVAAVESLPEGTTQFATGSSTTTTVTEEPPEETAHSNSPAMLVIALIGGAVVVAIVLLTVRKRRKK